MSDTERNLFLSPTQLDRVKSAVVSSLWWIQNRRATAPTSEAINGAPLEARRKYLEDALFHAQVNVLYHAVVSAVEGPCTR